MNEETMDIYAKPGTKVRYMNRNGYDAEREHANTLLKEGDVYTVLKVEVHSWHSSVILVEFPKERFNTVMFAGVEG